MQSDRIAGGGGPRVLAVCGSLKPAIAGAAPSACRELLKLALTPVRNLYPLIDVLDLRDARLPPFDGRGPSEYGSSQLLDARRAVENAAAYVFSTPAYWGGIGAAFKNFIETVCGPGYDGGNSPFAGKPGVVMIVGSDGKTAQAAALQMEAVLNALGILPVTRPIVVGDPGDLPDVQRAVQDLTAAAGSVVLALAAGRAVQSAYPS